MIVKCKWHHLHFWFIFVKRGIWKGYNIEKYGNLRLELENYKKAEYILKIHLTFANNCFKLYADFTEIGSDIFYEKRTYKNRNNSKRYTYKCY